MLLDFAVERLVALRGEKLAAEFWANRVGPETAEAVRHALWLVECEVDARRECHDWDKLVGESGDG